MRVNKKDGNNQGSTMIMVVLCIAFLGILGSLMLSVSLINYQMKKVESKSKNNFYSCETALQEIKVGLEELSAKQITSTYTYVIQNYSSYAAMNDENRNKSIQASIVANINAKLGASIDDKADAFEKYLTNTAVTVVIGNEIENTTTLPFDIMFKDVKLTYTENGFNTTITTDLRIKLPTFTLDPNADTLSYNMTQPFANYAVVADGGIYSENTEGTNRINGYVYSGDGITVNNPNPALMKQHTLELNGGYITTRGNITVKNTAALTIGDSTKPISTNPIICANNITTESTTNYNNQTTLNIDGICLTKDDLAINGQKSKVTLKGAYVGYTATHTAEGSAIMINGSDSSLDLSGLSSLILAGRAHVTVEDIDLKGNDLPSDINIMTGESLAIKSNQRAYLIPGNYLNLNNQPVMHNPINSLDAPTGTSVTIKIPSTASPINYSTYLNASPNQYKMVSKLENTTTLRYYYMNFASGKKADQYLVDFMNSYPNILQNLDAFKINSLSLPSNSKYVSAGNLMYYDTTTTPATVKSKPGKSTSYPNDADADTYIAGLQLNAFDSTSFGNIIFNDIKVSNLSDFYYNLTHYLSPTASSRILNDDDKVVATNILKSGITKALSDLQTGGYTAKSVGFTAGFSVGDYVSNNTATPSSKSIIVANGNAEIKPNTFFNGILVASGNVTIGSGAVVNGLIIAAGNATTKGDIELKDNVNVRGRVVAMNNVMMGKNCNIECTSTTFDSSLPVEDFLQKTFYDDAELLWNMFQNPELNVNIKQNTSVSDLVDIDKLVTCENWRKN